MILETERLCLREMDEGDFPALCRILQDEETMYAYEGAFSDEEARQWLDRQIARYRAWGFRRGSGWTGRSPATGRGGSGCGRWS